MPIKALNASMELMAQVAQKRIAAQQVMQQVRDEVAKQTVQQPTGVADPTALQSRPQSQAVTPPVLNPKVNSAIAPVTNKQGRSAYAVGMADFWKKQGYAVDGFAVSAAHHKANPTSDHETGKAIDIHTKGPDKNALASVLAKAKENNVKYVIHNNTIYNAKDGFTPRYYGGKFKNGATKNPHTTHIHVSFNQ